MTISKKQLEEEKNLSFNQGVQHGKKLRMQEVQDIRQSGIIDLTHAAAELAQANAKLTYAISRIADKLL